MMANLDPTPCGALSIDELISQILGGRSELYEEVIRRYQRDVSQVVDALLFDRGGSEELVQQVFVNAYFALGQFQRGRDFGAWIRAIARNAVRQELRGRARYDRRLKTYAEMLQTELSINENAAPQQQTLVEGLEACIGRLPERERTAIHLRYREGKTFEEIAAILGGSAGTIRNLLCHARASLRRDMQREINQS